MEHVDIHMQRIVLCEFLANKVISATPLHLRTSPQVCDSSFSSPFVSEPNSEFFGTVLMA